MEWLITLLGTVITVPASVASLAYWLGRKFTEIEARFRIVDERFRGVDERFKHIEERFNRIDGRFEQIDGRFGQIDKRFGELERMLRAEVRRGFLLPAQLIRALHSNLIDFMTVKKVFTPEEREYLIREARRIVEAHTLRLNPLRPEEVEFIKQVLREVEEKDSKEVDLGKLDKVMEIADRWFLEDGLFEAAKLWIIAYTLKAILRAERGEL